MLFTKKLVEAEEDDYEEPELLRLKIMDLDPDVIGCYAIRVQDGVVVVDWIGDEYRGKIKPFSNTGAGMASKWGLVGLSASKRMDDERGRTKYIVAARERFSSLLFLHPRNQNLEIGIMLKASVDPRKVYEAAMENL